MFKDGQLVRAKVNSFRTYTHTIFGDLLHETWFALIQSMNQSVVK